MPVVRERRRKERERDRERERGREREREGGREGGTALIALAFAARRSFLAMATDDADGRMDG